MPADEPDDSHQSLDNGAAAPLAESADLRSHSPEANGFGDHSQAQAAAPAEQQQAQRPPKPPYHADAGQRVGGKVSPPNPYSEEGAQAAEACLAEVGVTCVHALMPGVQATQTAQECTNADV